MLNAGRSRLDRVAEIAVWLGAIAYATTLTWLGIWRYSNFRASIDDGIFTQVVGSALSGFRATPEWNFNHLATHFSPDLYLLAPMVIASHSTTTLIAAQAIAGALVAPPLFYIARKRMASSLAAACALVALLYPPLVSLTFTDFHENGIEPAAIVWLIWAIDAGKLRLAIAIGLFALCIKEDVAPGLVWGGLLGGVWLFRRGDRSRALAAFLLAGSGAIVFAGYLGVLRPALHPPFPYQQFRYYAGERAFTAADAVKRLHYVGAMLRPLAFLPLLSPAALLTIPGFIEVLASKNDLTMSLETHYAGVWIGYMLVAFVAGVAVVYRRAPVGAGAALALCGALSFYYTVPKDPMARWYALYRLPNAHDATLQALIDGLPADAAVSAPDRLYAHMGFDPNATTEWGGRYLILDRTNNDVPQRWVQYEQDLPKAVASGQYRLVRATDGIELYERGTNPGRRLLDRP